eukprot:jgi/Astpho2/2447/fgenesh1_pg.00045_%23_1_t
MAPSASSATLAESRLAFLCFFEVTRWPCQYTGSKVQKASPPDPGEIWSAGLVLMLEGQDGPGGVTCAAATAEQESSVHTSALRSASRSDSTAATASSHVASRKPPGVPHMQSSSIAAGVQVVWSGWAKMFCIHEYCPQSLLS